MTSLPCEHCEQVHEGDELYCPRTGQLMAERLLPAHTMLEDKYLIHKPIGVGGMGAVFEATHTLLDKKVAVKVMLSPNEEATARFVREARAASATGHRNITSVTDMGRTPMGSLFVVMEFLDGHTVRELTADGPLQIERALGIAEQALAGLATVHKKGIIHRDLKPDNLMVVPEDDDDGEVVKILDFGISKALSEDSNSQELTSTGIVMGTPLYMAPEQAKAEKLGPAADIYAMGAILYSMLTANPPHLAENLSALIAAKIERLPDPPSSHNPNIPPEVDRLVLKALAIEPKDRYPRAIDMRRAVLELLGDQPALANCVTDPEVQLPSGPDLPTGLDDAIFTGELITLDGATDAQATAEREAAKLAPPVAPKAPPRKKSNAPPPATQDPFSAPGMRGVELELDREEAVELARPMVTAPFKPGEVGIAHARLKPKSRLPLLIALVVLAGAGAAAYKLFGKQLKQHVLQKPQQEVQIRFKTTPKGAEITIDGVLLATQPLFLRPSNRTYQARVTARGYHPKQIAFTAESDQLFTVELSRKDAIKRTPSVRPKGKNKSKKKKRRRRSRKRAAPKS